MLDYIKKKNNQILLDKISPQCLVTGLIYIGDGYGDNDSDSKMKQYLHWPPWST
jgi:hypothetical protein